MTSNCRIRHLGVQAWFKCSLALENMVLCAMIGCSNRTERDKGKRFFRLPAVISHQGDQTHELSTRRQREWMATIKRKDLNLEKLQYIRVCSDHFVHGSPAKLYDSTNPDWVPLSLNWL